MLMYVRMGRRPRPEGALSQKYHLLLCTIYHLLPTTYYPLRTYYLLSTTYYNRAVRTARRPDGSS